MLGPMCTDGATPGWQGILNFPAVNDGVGLGPVRLITMCMFPGFETCVIVTVILVRAISMAVASHSVGHVVSGRQGHAACIFA